MANEIVWTEEDMILAACEHWGDGHDESDCRVIRDVDSRGEPCLVVLHVPTGKTTNESGDGGRWHLDGTAY